MAGHLARNQVHAGSIPAALTDVNVGPSSNGKMLPSHRRDRSSILRGSTTHGSVLLGEQPVSKAGGVGSNPTDLA